MIEANNVSKYFDGSQILYDVTAKFESGKTNLIIGQSGSGKTVFMKCLIGLHTPEQGEIFYDGRPFTKMSSSERKHLRTEIGMLFQGSALFDNETVLGNVMFPLKMFSSMSRKEQIERAKFCIQRVGLENADEKYPSEISGGMQKRVAIARAIVLEPKYLFCDEPNSGLDPKTSIVIDELIAGITHEDKITTIVNTHDMNSVMGIGENITFICEGRAEWQGNNKEIMDASNKKLEDFIFSSDILRQAKELHDQQKK